MKSQLNICITKEGDKQSLEVTSAENGEVKVRFLYEIFFNPELLIEKLNEVLSQNPLLKRNRR